MLDIKLSHSLTSIKMTGIFAPKKFKASANLNTKEKQMPSYFLCSILPADTLRERLQKLIIFLYMRIKRKPHARFRNANATYHYIPSVEQTSFRPAEHTGCPHTCL